MALTQTPVCAFDSTAPPFSLPDFDGRVWTLEDCRGAHGTLVMFICNHCPYVKAICTPLVEDVRVLQAEGIGVVGVMPNDFDTYPEDAPEKMRTFARENSFSFPYLIDRDQRVARAYGAVCTPDFFGFNSDLKLQYRGRLNATTPGRTPSTTPFDPARPTCFPSGSTRCPK